MKNKKNRSGQTMVEYIIIVVLIAVTLIALVGLLGKSAGRKYAGVTSAIDDEVGTKAQAEYNKISDSGDGIRKLSESGDQL